jgi:hypothetical protein
VVVGKQYPQRKRNKLPPCQVLNGIGLTKWFDQKWVNIGAPKKKGKYQACGTSGKGGSGYAKCVPVARARSMSAAQKKSAVQRKRAQGTPQKGVKGQAPKNVSTFKKRKK